MKPHHLYALLILTISFFSCSKESGFGGNSAIVGKIQIKHYNQDFSMDISTEPLLDEYVYLIFDDQPGYGTRVKTAYDGSFEINNLTVGKYQLYVYSKDSTPSSVNGIVAITKDIEITKKKEIVDAGTLTTIDNDVTTSPVVINYASTITGKVKEIDIDTNEEYYIGDQRVYLIHGNDINYSTSIKTNYNGEYQFLNLQSGTYTLYTYSKDVFDDYPGPDYAVTLNTTINTNEEDIAVADLIIYR